MRGGNWESIVVSEERWLGQNAMASEDGIECCQGHRGGVNANAAVNGRVGARGIL